MAIENNGGVRNVRDVTIGIDLNSMTSRGLIEYGKTLKKDIERLQGVDNLSKAEKEELKNKLAAQKVVTHSLKRINDFASALKKAGFDIGKLNDLSINSIALQANSYADRINTLGDTSKAKNIRNIVNKYKNSTTTVMGTSLAGGIVQGGMKITGYALIATSAGMTINGIANSIGGIPLAGTEFQNVAGWIAKNMPWFKGAIAFALAGATMLVAAKKLSEFTHRKNMTVADAMTHQLDADNYVEEHSKNVSIESEAVAIAANPHDLNLLKETVKGKDIDSIIFEGPTSKRYSAEEWKAARILKQIEKNYAQDDIKKESMANSLANADTRKKLADQEAKEAKDNYTKANDELNNKKSGLKTKSEKANNIISENQKKLDAAKPGIEAAEDKIEKLEKKIADSIKDTKKNFKIDASKFFDELEGDIDFNKIDDEIASCESKLKIIQKNHQPLVTPTLKTKIESNVYGLVTTYLQNKLNKLQTLKTLNITEELPELYAQLKQAKEEKAKAIAKTNSTEAKKYKDKLNVEYLVANLDAEKAENNVPDLDIYRAYSDAQEKLNAAKQKVEGTKFGSETQDLVDEVERIKNNFNNDSKYTIAIKARENARHLKDRFEEAIQIESDIAKIEKNISTAEKDVLTPEQIKEYEANIEKLKSLSEQKDAAAKAAATELEELRALKPIEKQLS